MPWQVFKFRIAPTGLARAEALLNLAGAESIAISDAGNAPIHEPAPGTTPLWPELEVRALFRAGVGLDAVAALLGPLAPAAAGIETIDDDAVERSLRQTVEPLEIGPRLQLAPAEAPADPRSLRLHMGLAFGTGRHPTTRLCLEWLERAEIGGAAVLDYGCGSGVLALAALRLGAARATAVDIEPQALEATGANARLNGLEHAIRIGLPAAVGAERCSLVLANILADPLIALAPQIAAQQMPGDRLVMSGILTTQRDGVAAAYAPWYGDFETRERDGWALLTGRRHSGYDS